MRAHEIVDRVARGGAVGGLELAHVLGDARHALEAGFLVEEVGDLLGAHLLLGHQIEQHARIELAAARAHRQAVERGEAHGRGDRAAVLDRAHRGAVAEMGDDHVLARDLGRDLLQRARDVFVGQAVESVAAHALVVIATAAARRCRDTNGWLRWKAVSKQATCGVSGKGANRRLDAGDVVRLVQRRERDELCAASRAPPRRSASARRGRGRRGRRDGRRRRSRSA